MYHFQALNETRLKQIAECFNFAFSDYEQPIHFTPESFCYYLTASGVDLSLSFGAFYGEQLVAIILNSAGRYNGESGVFDAGTGVVPEHRGKKVFSSLLTYTVQQLREKNITKYYLETLQTNHHAVAIYKNKGFSVLREYSVLTASGPRSDWDKQIPACAYSEFESFETQFATKPSFEHTSHTIDRNPQLYEVLYLPDQAYCIYAKRHGEVIQLHYNSLNALKDVMSGLIARYPSAMAKNIDYNCSEVIEMLKEIGFVEILKQYEMVMDI